jgi:hypothetical protein
MCYLGRHSCMNDFANDGGRGGGHNVGMGLCWGHPRRRSPRGDKMGSKINILSKKICDQQILNLS